MTYKGHLAGGLLVSAGATAAFAVGAGGEFTAQTIGGVFATTLFFSLSPDLDTSSRPQRWYFKLVFIILAGLAWNEQFRLATALALVAIMPVLDHHRGWTHHRLSPPLALGAAGALCGYWMLPEEASFREWVTQVTDLARSDILVIAGAAILGWYTHLILDGLLRIFPATDD